MSPAVAVLAGPEELALAGVRAGGATSSWLWCGSTDAAGSVPAAPELVVLLQTGAVREAAVAAGTGASVARIRWLDGSAPPAGDSAHPGDPGAERVIAQAGSGLWRRAPWPVADELFGVPAPAPSAPVLVVGEPQAAAEAAAALDGHGVSATPAVRMTRAGLEAGVAVLELPSPQGGAPAGLLAPLAARRPLLRLGAAPDFGLQAGVDHLAVADLDQAAALLSTLVAQPRAFDMLRAFGAITARRHRASEVYKRLLADVRLERAAAPAPS